MRKVSKKRAIQISKYSKIKKLYLEENPCCQVRLDNCTGCGPVEIHHKKGKINELLYDSNYFLTVCRNCHNIIEANPSYAYEKGFSIKRNSNENFSNENG